MASFPCAVLPFIVELELGVGAWEFTGPTGAGVVDDDTGRVRVFGEGCDMTIRVEGCWSELLAEIDAVSTREVELGFTSADVEEAILEVGPASA